MTATELITVASSEVGYLEKASVKSLDSKTANAGSGNYTKYWRDIYPVYQGQAWCLCFVVWCFVKTFGEQTARKLLHMKTAYTFYTPTAAAFFKSAGAWHPSPKIGDLIFFRNSSRIHHVGIVYNVTASRVYTIEGNTSSGAEVVANGGAVRKKSYLLTNANIAGYARPDYPVDFVPYMVTPTTVLNVRRSGAGSEILGTVNPGHNFTIREEKDGWGRVLVYTDSSNRKNMVAGWVSLKYTRRV